MFKAVKNMSKFHSLAGEIEKVAAAVHQKNTTDIRLKDISTSTLQKSTINSPLVDPEEKIINYIKKNIRDIF